MMHNILNLNELLSMFFLIVFYTRQRNAWEQAQWREKGNELQLPEIEHDKATIKKKLTN